jgi:hypothetical protein
VVVGGYGAPGSSALGGDERFITWAEETSFTDSFWANGVEEAWVVIWPEHLGSADFLTGVDLAAFAADYTDITGKPFPVAVPPTPVPVPPAPVPVPPTPVPTPPAHGPNAADRALNEAIGDWPEQHHMGAAGQIAAALRAWQLAQGFGGRRREDS